MKFLSLNCQKAYQPGLELFLKATLEKEKYDFLLLQEVNEIVLALIEEATSYRFLTASDTAGVKSRLCIVYRNSIELLSYEFHSYAAMRLDPVRVRKHSSFGLLCGKFRYQSEGFCICSVHLPSGIDARIRVRKIHKTKEVGLRFAGSLPVVIGGDFNFGYPGELGRACRLLAPECVCATRTLGSTLDSRYSEYSNHLLNRMAVALAKVGLGVKLKADHFMVNACFASAQKMTVRILPDRVSDHSPIELISETTAR